MKTVINLNGDRTEYDSSLQPKEALANDYILKVYGASALHNLRVRAEVTKKIEETKNFYIIDSGSDLIGVRK